MAEELNPTPPAAETPDGAAKKRSTQSWLVFALVAVLVVGGSVTIALTKKSGPNFTPNIAAFCTRSVVDGPPSVSPSDSNGRTEMAKWYQSLAEVAPNQASYDKLHAVYTGIEGSIGDNAGWAALDNAGSAAQALKVGTKYPDMANLVHAVIALKGTKGALVAAQVTCQPWGEAASSVKNAANEAFVAAQGSGVGVATANIYAAYNDGGASATSIPASMTAGSGGVVKYSVSIKNKTYNYCVNFPATPGTPYTFDGVC